MSYYAMVGLAPHGRHFVAKTRDQLLRWVSLNAAFQGTSSEICEEYNRFNGRLRDHQDFDFSTSGGDNISIYFNPEPEEEPWEDPDACPLCDSDRELFFFPTSSDAMLLCGNEKCEGYLL